MKPIFIILALACAAGSARADLLLQQQIVTRNYNAVATLKVRGAQIRLDLYAGQPRAISVITDLKTGDIVTLLHNQKMFVKVPGAQNRQSNAAANPAPRPRATGKMEKVGGYETEIYTWSNSRGITGSAWVAKNYPDFAKIRTGLAVLDKYAAEKSDSPDPELSALPGMVVKSQIAGSGQTITSTLLSVRDEPVDASFFQIPAGYKELPRPQPLKIGIPPNAPKSPGK